MTAICLCMIVRDEAEVIERCLASVRGLIDRWVICDTGSGDDTRTLIEAALHDVPGELHERTWVDFGHNRTELMTLAQGKADYLLLIDADMTVSFDRARLAGLTADSYSLRHAEDPEYWIKRLVRGDRSWRYVGATHEYITTDSVDRTERLDAIVIHHHQDGGTRAEKFERDLRLLSREHERNPGDPRTVFYLAQTLRDLGRLDEAIHHYERRAGLEGWEEEAFYSLYQVGALNARLARHPQAVEALLRAWNRAPRRAESLVLLAGLFRERGEYHLAHLVAKRGLRIRMPVEGLFVERWVYEWGLLFEYSIAAYWVGQPREALETCDRLLALPQLPEAHRRQTIENRRYCMRAMAARPATTSLTALRWRPPDDSSAARRTEGAGDGTITIIEGGHRLTHRGTDADRAVIRQVFTERAYALDRLEAWPGLARYVRAGGAPAKPLIVDLGAHIGAASVWFALRHPDAQVIALEPDPANFDLLRENAAGFPHIKPLRRAIARHPGSVNLIDPGRGSWAMRASAEPGVTRGTRVGEVEAVSIDQLLEDAPGTVPFILKMDIEGAEGDVFTTHWQAFARFPLVIVELHDWLLPGMGTSRPFLRWHTAHNRDLVPVGGNLFSVAQGSGAG